MLFGPHIVLQPKKHCEGVRKRIPWFTYCGKNSIGAEVWVYDDDDAFEDYEPQLITLEVMHRISSKGYQTLGAMSEKPHVKDALKAAREFSISSEFRYGVIDYDALTKD